MTDIERMARDMCTAQGACPDGMMHGRARWQSYTKMAQAAYDALVGDGVVVPREATEKMLHAAERVTRDKAYWNFKDIYAALIEARQAKLKQADCR